MIAPTRLEDPTLKGYADTWLTARELKPRTKALYRDLLDKLILPRSAPSHDPCLPREGPRVVRHLDPSTPTRRAHAYGLLRTIMTTAVADELVAANPCRIRGAGSSKTRHRAKVASLPEIEMIVGADPGSSTAPWCCSRPGAGCGSVSSRS